MNSTRLLSTTAAWGSEAPASLLAGNGASPQGRTALQEIPLLHHVPELHGQAPDRPSSPSPVRASLGPQSPRALAHPSYTSPKRNLAALCKVWGEYLPSRFALVLVFSFDRKGEEAEVAGAKTQPWRH